MGVKPSEISSSRLLSGSERQRPRLLTLAKVITLQGALAVLSFLAGAYGLGRGVDDGLFHD